MSTADMRGRRYPIGVVARQTGLTTHTLRAWEQRYQVVVPERTDGGQRLYRAADIERLRLLRQATDLGHPISGVAGMDAASLRRLVREDASEEPVGRMPAAACREVVDVALEKARGLDGRGVHGLLMRAAVRYGADVFMDDVALALLNRVGERWAAGGMRPAEEHVISGAVRQVLAWMLEQMPAEAGAPPIVLATLPGEQHELGAMLAAVLAVVEGWRPIHLGNLPVAEIAAAARTAGAGVVAVSLIMPAGARHLGSLRKALPQHVVLVTGGPAAPEGPGGIVRLADLDVFRARLREWAPSAALAAVS